ncbi:MAG: hypothetical protein KHX03_05710 [Clostridium sp.]|nr:hypothetical protein [Clostridium sp.]
MNINSLRALPLGYFEYNQVLKPKNHLNTSQPSHTLQQEPKLPGYNSYLSFHPSFGYYPKSTIDALKFQENSPMYKFESSDIFDDIPNSYERIFYGKQANILGAGAIFSNFLKLGETIDFYYDKNSGEIGIFDPKLLQIDEIHQEYKGYNILKGLDDIENGVVYIISPNKFHTPQINALSKNQSLNGIYTDKPICISRKELAELENTVKTSKTPLYFGDFFFFSQLPALRLMGVKMPYKEAVTIQFDDSKDKKFSNSIKKAKAFYTPDEIKNIICKTIEHGAEDFEKRKWLKDKSEGGGVILDLQVHISNLLNLMGLELTDINYVSAEKFKDTKFSAVHKNEAEDRAVIKGRLNKKIPVYMETAQYMKNRETYILIEGKDGNKIKISTDVFDKKTELLDKENNVIARAYTVPRPYSLMIHHAQTCFDDPKTKDIPMFFDVQRKTMKQLFTIKDIIDEQIENNSY